jgi:hypothetical protein
MTDRLIHRAARSCRFEGRRAAPWISLREMAVAAVNVTATKGAIIPTAIAWLFEVMANGSNRRLNPHTPAWARCPYDKAASPIWDRRADSIMARARRCSIRSRIYECSCTTMPTPQIACKPGGVHIRLEQPGLQSFCTTPGCANRATPTICHSRNSGNPFYVRWIPTFVGMTLIFIP